MHWAWFGGNVKGSRLKGGGNEFFVFLESTQPIVNIIKYINK